MERPKHVRDTPHGLRCANCDHPVTEDGKWIDDEESHGEMPDECPDCGAIWKPIR